MRKSQLELKVRAASQPPPQQNPAELGAQAALKELLQKAMAMVDREAEIAMMPPQGKNGNLAPQVSAADHIVKTALDTLKVAGGAK